MACTCRAASTLQSHDTIEQHGSAMPWGYAAAGALMAGIAGSHVAHAEAEVHPTQCSAAALCTCLCGPACCNRAVISKGKYLLDKRR